MRIFVKNVQIVSVFDFSSQFLAQMYTAIILQINNILENSVYKRWWSLLLFSPEKECFFFSQLLAIAAIWKQLNWRLKFTAFWKFLPFLRKKLCNSIVVHPKPVKTSQFAIQPLAPENIERAQPLVVLSLARTQFESTKKQKND